VTNARGLFAIDAEGHRLDVDAWAALELAVTREALTPSRSPAPGDVDRGVAAFELVETDQPPVVFPTTLGAAEIANRVYLAGRGRRRGPLSRGPAITYGKIVEMVAMLWLTLGRAPTLERTAEALEAYPDPGNLSRAIKGIGWVGVKFLAIWQLGRWQERLLEQIKTAGSPTLEQQRLLERFDRLTGDNAPPQNPDMA
jgi:hypothetical protein